MGKSNSSSFPFGLGQARYRSHETRSHELSNLYGKGSKDQLGMGHTEVGDM
jgi:hypothetical protein